MNSETKFQNITEFKEYLFQLNLTAGYYHDLMYEARDDEKARTAYFSKMIQMNAEIDELKSEYLEYTI